MHKCKEICSQYSCQDMPPLTFLSIAKISLDASQAIPGAAIFSYDERGSAWRRRSSEPNSSWSLLRRVAGSALVSMGIAVLINPRPAT